ncbi:hypothetical protein GGI43DRAFT_401039 [Trichoderma evansii]
MHQGQLQGNLAPQCHSSFLLSILLSQPFVTFTAAVVFPSISRDGSSKADPLKILVQLGLAKGRRANAMDVRRLCKWTPKSKLLWHPRC